ncbi:hypothetical protein J2786_001842 [Chryseobacterium vietnamense]|jgi:hypothetical protein|uniref:Uncharacterized protein n=1 Tax=Chryseobacterium vietnamense TaxID=866785 RepID=A0ACC6J6R4_9FLAO|nr:hypothetical protein [Chryseobacterium vietnamense]MDR6458749.1 hypothetical protein [Chryseobacterium vietnamense]
MDHVETTPIDLIKDKNFIDNYFSIIIKRELNIDINVGNEYIVAQNIISRKLILVKTFSDVIMENSELYTLLASLIHDVNTHLLTKDQIMKTLERK